MRALKMRSFHNFGWLLNYIGYPEADLYFVRITLAGAPSDPTSFNGRQVRL
jgi:hypothetical protein